jgi:hypothetical protein
MSQTDKDKTAASKPTGKTGRKAAMNGRESTQDMERNRRAMGVAEDHRTEAMKKGKRGSFP